ncbi:sporulation membrane protein YtaF [Paenibacillus sp. WQ 127069]|uniref:Sporulation membrane protein YtaF n=1 Tax=Paenibacillus baimaensis TaxID=2982185 RepID=A0ABT2UK35_9BACL|nr:sporulation membrane protein YtaF [Paenibacillus sp. WQ 127069]MCU6795004.1 sporulation membrane protein YtaF [Paenibacillus sp. WQ 127069]
MHWISIIFIALASNLDNLGIGISFGIRSTRIPALSNGIIAVITMLGTYVSVTLGEYMTAYMPGFAANLLGAFMILFIGVWGIVSSRRRAQAPEPSAAGGHSLIDVIHQPATADVDLNKVISWKEALTLGLALALNNMATGFGAGATGVSPLWTTVAAGLFSIVFISCGTRIGLMAAKTWVSQYADLIGGILLILIGIYEMVA